MDKRINHQFLQEKWQKIRYHSVPDGRPKFSMIQPPPNVTGVLHMGHALNNVYQDMLARHKRLQGYNVCWVPGTDHAGIATQSKVETILRQEGLTKHQLGKEEFLKRVWQWKDKCRDVITSQIKQLGCSCDWEREKFTLDPDFQILVRRVFCRLYQNGMIYRGNFICNWCPALQTVVSDEETQQTEEKVDLYHIAYSLEPNDMEGPTQLVVATTRPETLFGDLAVACHPSDERYTQYIGRHVIVPLINQRVPVISDYRVTPKFGTGLVKITPAHSRLDDEIWKSWWAGKGENAGQSEIKVVLDKSANVVNTGTRYDGMYRWKARKEVVKDLQDQNLLVKVESKISSISRCCRTQDVIEPMLTQQWFVYMKPLGEIARQMVESGQVEILPKNQRATFDRWIEQLNDWCISRQLWWGHQIPVWYCEGDGHHTICSEQEPQDLRCHCGHVLKRDEDTLDTWFSSWLWAFGIFNRQEMPYYFPTDVCITGVDILFFWIIRMMMSSGYFHQTFPFRQVYLHGIVRDEHHKKMSKCAGNIVDPLDLIQKYGVDPLRFTLVYITPIDSDLVFSEDRCANIGVPFCTKFWNICRFCQGAGVFSADLATEIDWDFLGDEDRSTANQLTQLQKEIDQHYERLEFVKIVTKLHSFVWNDFACRYLEYSKQQVVPTGSDSDNKAVMRKSLMLRMLRIITQLLHPIIPHVTEEIWEIMGDQKLYESTYEHLRLLPLSSVV